LKERKWVKIVCNLDLFLASIALVILTLVTFAAVIMRYVLKAPLLWQEEAQAFCQVWMIFLGASVAFRQGSIVAIEMFVDSLPEKKKKIMEYIVDIIVVFTLTFLMVKCQQYISQVFGKTHRGTAILGIPYELIYGIAPYGCGLMIIFYLVSKYLPVFVKKYDYQIAPPPDPEMTEVTAE
jgi:TRAP-type C4-dicarboxylate transport system permease small subunit